MKVERESVIVFRREWTAFPAQHVRYGERGKAGERARMMEGGGSSPWNFNQRQLLAGVARSPYIRTFLLETQQQNSIFLPFSPLFLFSLCLSRPGCENVVVVVVVVARKGSNRQVLLRDARRLILVPPPLSAPFVSAFRFS